MKVHDEDTILQNYPIDVVQRYRKLKSRVVRITM